MAVSYKKLWKLLIDKDMKKKDLCIAAGISHASMAKLEKRKCYNRCTRKDLYRFCNVTSVISWNLSRIPRSERRQLNAK